MTHLPGILLVGHGTRDPRGQAEFQQTFRDLAARVPDRPVEACHLELVSPDIATGVSALAMRGVREMAAVPVLLFAAGHAGRDIPAALAAARSQHSGVTIRQAAALEFHPAIVELSELRFQQALTNAPSVAARDSLLLLIGRGSSDADAPDKLRRFATLRAGGTPVGRVEIGFVAAAHPTLAEALAAAAASGYRRVVVQPHLLFYGEVLTEIRHAVAGVAAEHPTVEWLVTEHLGPDSRLISALLERAGSAR